MNKVLAKNGARHNMEVLFDDLQLYIKNGILQTLNGFIDSYGIIAKRAQDGTIDAADTSLKVSYVTPGYANISDGYGISSSMSFMSVDTPQSFALPTTAGTHTLYIKAQHIDAGYTAVMNGFKYAVGENLTASREIDSYVFVWDAAPDLIASGLVLADVVTTSGLTVTGITDRRHENVFTINTDSFPPTVVRTDYANLQTLISDVTVSGVLKVNNAEVLTVGATPLTPIRFVIKDVLPTESIEHLDNDMTPLLPLDMQKAVASTHVTTKLEWGHCDVTDDYVASGLIRIDTTTYPGMTNYVNTGEMIGMHAYSTRWSKDYYIYQSTWDGTNNKLYISVRNIDGSGTTEDLHGGWIFHEGAEYYEVVAIPENTGVVDTRQIREWVINYSTTDIIGNKVVRPQATIDIPIGQKYHIYVRSCNQFMKSAYRELQASTYTKETNPLKYTSAGVVTYTSPFLAKLANLNVGTATAVATPTYAGFKLSINPGSLATDGWSLATAYEVLYTSATGGVNTTTPNYQRVVTQHTDVEIATPGRYLYYIVVRPLVGGQIAGTVITTTVTSGGGGAAPNDGVIATIPVNFRTYQCIIDYVDTGSYHGGGSEISYVADIINIVTPAYSGIETLDAGLVNGDFAAGNLSGWVSHTNSPMVSGIAGHTEYDSGHAKMYLQNPPAYTDSLCQGVIIPSGVSSITYAFDLGFTGTSGSNSFLVNVVLAQSLATPPIGTTLGIAFKNITSASIGANTISAAIPNGWAGKAVYITFQAIGSGAYYFTLDNVIATWKLNPGSTGVSFTQDINGEILQEVSTGKEYVVGNLLSSTGGRASIMLRPVTGTSGSPSLGSIGRIGTTERGRTVYKSHSFPIDYEITKAYFDCDILLGRKCCIRWYQEGTVGKALVDYLLVPGSDQSVVKDTDVQIIEAQGSRNIVVDLYEDPVGATNPDNFSGITGTLVLFGRPLLL
jgi:hypothetical protein